MPRNFSFDLFNAYWKLVQFLYIILKKDKDLEQSQNLMRHVKEQVEHLKLDEVISIIIKFLKNCPDELITMRSDLVYRMKTFLTCKREGTIPPDQIDKTTNEITQNVLELIDDEAILGKNIRMAPTIRSNM